jgi:hypothetical protein
MPSITQPMLARAKTGMSQHNPGGLDCYCCNDYASSKHGSKSIRMGRQQNKQTLKRREERQWREYEEKASN